MREILAGAKKKRKEAEVFKIDAENFSVAELEEKIKGQGLFEKKFIVVLDKVFENKLAMDEILARLKEMKETENLFLILEQKINKPELTKFEKYTEKIYKFEAEVSAKKEFNDFALANALGNRDRKNLWLLYRQMIEREVVLEAISGMIFWKVKDMFLKKNFSKFSESELKKLSSKLVEIYHDSHRGLCDFENAMEQFILNI